ncbi:unnamed protein product [Adineta steineri]|uniref:Uncharacterized protein n=3 Tax=Adineta steineri TaxID=433720 RepID=A0A813VZF9_9BILA|nr:unnamed protein product [Adineta steineri]CAF0854992.1 unnamed protein product [Adineta steineri]CAF3790476.1 unnamed protein product [Adineta steineri]
MVSQICHTPSWFKYERGLINEEQVYKAVVPEMNNEYSSETIKKVIETGRSALAIQTALMEFLQILSKSKRYRLFAMSNISEPDYAFVQSRFGSTINMLFERIFPSYASRDRKPNLSFFQHVLTQIDVSPSQTLLIDDEIDNIIAARSLGIHGFLFKEKYIDKNLRYLFNMCQDDPCNSAIAYLQRHAGQHFSITSEGNEIKENFSQLLILEAMRDASLVSYVAHTRLFNFFQDESMALNFPCDIDTTSIGLTVLDNISSSVIHNVLDQILSTCLSDDGIIQVYFDSHHPRVDPVVCVNALALFYTHGRGHEVHRTEQWVYDVLVHRAYKQGTRYYNTAECFLFFLARLLKRAPLVREKMISVLWARIEERLANHETDPLVIALRLLAADAIGMTEKTTPRIAIDLEQLCMLQEADGSWNGGPFLKYGSHNISMSNRGLTTALAVNAIRAYRQ